MNYEENHSYSNIIICCVKIAEQLVGKSVYNGLCLFINSTAPTGQRLGMTLAMVTALVLAMITKKPDNQQEQLEISLAASHEAIIDLILSKYQIVRDRSIYRYEELQMAMLAYFRNQPGCIFVESKPSAVTNAEEEREGAIYQSKELPSRPGVIYMETVSGSSKIKENLIRVKSLLEYRLFLHAIGIQNISSKQPRLQDVCHTYGYSAEDLRRLLDESFDNRAYTKKEIEETMKVDLINLVSEVPYASQSMDSIFSLNPFS